MSLERTYSNYNLKHVLRHEAYAVKAILTPKSFSGVLCTGKYQCQLRFRKVSNELGAGMGEYQWHFAFRHETDT